MYNVHVKKNTLCNMQIALFATTMHGETLMSFCL